jgi:MtrB/PioB family decaheme-associated outer membrane protein
MMKMPTRNLHLAMLLTMCLPTAAIAQVDTSEWKCELCPFEDGYRAELDVGAIYVSDSAARFGNATGLDDAGAYAELNGNGHYAGDAFQLGWTTSNLALDSRELGIELGRQGTYGVYANYDEIPYRRFGTTSTVYTANGNDALNLPPGWVAAGTTSAMTALATSLRPQDIGSDRQTIALGGFVLPADNFKVIADYARQNRDGIDIVSGSGFATASLLPRVIDQQTDTVNLGVEYGNGPLHLALAWYGSFFDNNASSLTWDNAFFNDPLTPGFEPRRIALEPRNDFQQLSLSGSYRLTLFNTHVAFNAASGRGEQNEPLLPYTVNPDIVANALPRANFDGQIDTTNYSLTLISRPVARGRVNLSYRYDERDNQSSRDLWTRVIVDTFASPETDLNTPYSFDRSRLSAKGEYRLFDTLRVSGGYDRTTLNRDFQEVAEQTEESGWGRARWQPLDWLNIIAKGGTSRREIDRYDESIATSFGQNPLLRKYNLAYRYREFGELAVSLAPAGLPISAGISAMLADDSYTESLFGLTDSENTHIALDLSWALSETASIYLLGGRETIDTRQTGSEYFAAPDWLAIHEDSFSHYGGGLNLNNIGERTDLMLDFTHTDGETRILVDRSGVSPGQYPDLDSRLDSLRLKLRYRKSDSLDIELGFRYESFTTRDWALAGVDPDTIPAVLSLGAAPYNYSVWVFSLSFRYLIGERSITFPE